MKYEYRMVSRFDGEWTLQSRPTKESWAQHYPKSDPNDWPDTWMWEFPGHGNYAKIVERANRLIAEQNYVPTELTPPFPDKDPKNPKKKRWFFF